MKMLTEENFRKTRDYIFHHGRYLDQKLFSFFFESGSVSSVIEALENFQNEDGGFGHGLEPDLRSPLSSTLATLQALGVLSMVSASSKEPLVEKTVGYLLNGFDENEKIWEMIPLEAQQSPHAFWWGGDDVKARFADYKINPTVAVIGYLSRYQDIVPLEFLKQAEDIVLERLGFLGRESEFYDLLCFVSLLEENQFPGNFRQKVIEHVGPVVEGSFEKDPKNWSGHCLTPLQVISSPQSPLTDFLDESLVSEHLDHEISSQLEDGSWVVPWTWEKAFPEAWKQAEKDWKGHLALKRLVTLKAFGRIVH